MPGMLGIVSGTSPEECQSLVKSMARSMEHESFYDSGMYSVPEMGIYAGWMAHENSTSNSGFVVDGFKNHMAPIVGAQ
jgi:asparagine synthase (glutamine-hydrolysing)